jgi:hypothetical protein
VSAPRYLVVYRQAGNEDDGKSATVQLYTARNRRQATRAVSMLNAIEADLVENTGGYPGEAYVIDLVRAPLPDVAICIGAHADWYATTTTTRKEG